jgi:hypothetical protein
MEELALAIPANYMNVALSYWVWLQIAIYRQRILVEQMALLAFAFRTIFLLSLTFQGRQYTKSPF